MFDKYAVYSDLCVFMYSACTSTGMCDLRGPRVKVCGGANSITLTLKQFPAEFNSCPPLQVSSPRTSVSSQRNKAPINSSRKGGKQHQNAINMQIQRGGWLNGEP